MGLSMPFSISNLPRLTNPLFSSCTDFLPVPTLNRKGSTFNLNIHCPGVFSFRKIVPLLTSHGYGVIVPELPGYGGTAKPDDVASYSRSKIGHSLKELLAAEDLNKVIVFGHDAVSAKSCMLSLRDINTLYIRAL